VISKRPRWWLVTAVMQNSGVMDASENPVAQSMVDAFSNRARKLYKI
jgi:ribosome-associated toxin RatA of RatAB toxin-antitoxin module